MSTVLKRQPPAHTCTPPMAETWVNLPKGPAIGPTRSTVRMPMGKVPDGMLGDLWRCDDCGKLWRVADACDACDFTGGQPHRGQCQANPTWRPATLWQRIRYRKEGRRNHA